ncbi:hypothetical protein ACJMK2_027993 [Sinanodonta woodiana]|uniref:Headcase middle domain-containing protein n=1 Tax=Sinanodonta woodiana TaxID=1069815 RepID=A0ABD3X5Y9_SINWO
MPHNRNNRNPRQHHAKADTNNNINENNNGVQPIGERENNNAIVKPCCVPTGCSTPDELIDQENPGNSVKVFCNNDQCVNGSFMHKLCFEEWEQTVLSYLRSCGRARSWSEKQRLQNLWTKKGYDLAFKACDCRCGRGHIRKDLDYIPPTPVVDNAKKNKKKKKSEPKSAVSGKTTANGSTVHENKPQLGSPTNTLVNNVNTNTLGNNGGNNVDNNDTLGVLLIRNRTSSDSSTGSSPPNSASSVTSGSPVPLSPLTNNVIRPTTRPKFDFQTDPPQSLTAASSFFKRRHDLSAFNLLPKHKQNPYHIKMEDDGPHGNDDTRIFVLTHLSSYRVNNLKCVLCRGDLSIFDRYPLIDGTLFLSPQAYDDSVVQVISEGRLQFINAVCVTCLEGGKDIRCAACKRKWDGSALQLGSMYTYDIFAAMPCCQKRLTCKHCRRAVVDVSQGLQYYSEYSHMIACPYCKAYDFHFIRPLGETFSVKRSIWN